MRNEYEIPILSQEDLVIDVGAHIGSFTCACLARGARGVIAFEPDSSSFQIAKSNVANFVAAFDCAERPILRQAAVWRSDRDERLFLTDARYNPILNSCHYAAQCTLFRDEDVRPVDSVALDRILDPFPYISILKLDCEGAEWPILLTSTQLHKVRKLLVELHSLEWKAAESGRVPSASVLGRHFQGLSVEDLKARLHTVGLHCTKERIHHDYLRNPAFYFGLVVFEHNGAGT